MIAHISGVPVEELLPLTYGGGVLLVAMRAFIQAKARTMTR